MHLYYRQYGQGEPLIILHGIFGLSDNWIPHAKKFADEGFKVYIPDQRNHGRSPHSNIFNYQILTDDLMRFTDEHSITNPTIMGHSMGGKVAMIFSLKYPVLLKKLIVVDMSPGKNAAGRQLKKIIKAMKEIKFDNAQNINDIDDQLKPNISEKRIRQFIMKNLYYRGAERKLAWRINFDAIYNNIDEMYYGIDEQSVFDKPTLFIKGEKSDYITDEDISEIKTNFPKAEINTIDGASHWVHSEKPEKFFNAVLKFIK